MMVDGQGEMMVCGWQIMGGVLVRVLVLVLSASGWQMLVCEWQMMVCLIKMVLALARVPVLVQVTPTVTHPPMRPHIILRPPTPTVHAPHPIPFNFNKF